MSDQHECRDGSALPDDELAIAIEEATSTLIALECERDRRMSERDNAG